LLTKGTGATARPRRWCDLCATRTPLYQHDAYAGAIDVTVASLDDLVVSAGGYTWTSDKIAQLELGDGLPRHLRTRFGEAADTARAAAPMPRFRNLIGAIPMQRDRIAAHA
jgi:hypothetical protein